jgi:hypothetical protein
VSAEYFSLFTDHLSPIFIRKSGGAAWLRGQHFTSKVAGDPLNLMRVMPPKGGPSHATAFRMALLFLRKGTADYADETDEDKF